MNKKHIEAMTEALWMGTEEPSREGIKKILENYWGNYAVAVFDVNYVKDICAERHIELDPGWAEEILFEFKENWMDDFGDREITYAIETVIDKYAEENLAEFYQVHFGRQG